VPRKAAAEELVFFVDRSLGGKLVVEALRKAGALVVAHDDESIRTPRIWNGWPKPADATGWF